jgi:hypothetical protein
VLAAFHESYYATAATVIPRFMFLIVFETRVLNVRPKLGGKLYTVVMELIPMPLFVVLFVFAEWTCFVALRDGHDPAHWRRELLRLAIDLQLLAILSMGVLVVLSPITGRRTWFPAMKERGRKDDAP